MTRNVQLFWPRWICWKELNTLEASLNCLGPIAPCGVIWVQACRDHKFGAGIPRPGGLQDGTEPLDYCALACSSGREVRVGTKPSSLK